MTVTLPEKKSSLFWKTVWLGKKIKSERNMKIYESKFPMGI